MKATNVTLVHEAFANIDKQVHAHINGKYFRIFGEGQNRRIREVIASTRQPLVKGKKLVA